MLTGLFWLGFKMSFYYCLNHYHVFYSVSVGVYPVYFYPLVSVSGNVVLPNYDASDFFIDCFDALLTQVVSDLLCGSCHLMVGTVSHLIFGVCHLCNY